MEEDNEIKFTPGLIFYATVNIVFVFIFGLIIFLHPMYLPSSARHTLYTLPGLFLGFQWRVLYFNFKGELLPLVVYFLGAQWQALGGITILNLIIGAYSTKFEKK